MYYHKKKKKIWRQKKNRNGNLLLSPLFETLPFRCHWFDQIRTLAPLVFMSTSTFFTKKQPDPPPAQPPPPPPPPRRNPMANPITTKILFSILLSLLLVSSSLASSDVPFIVAHKKATPRGLKSGAERVSVSIDIYNQGSSWVPICLSQSN